MNPKILIILGTLLLLGCQSVLSQPAPTAVAMPTAAGTEAPFVGVALATRVPPTAVVLQTTPSPLPPPTETPTPTPIVYVIEEGDTLLGIAIQRSTTVDEIEALNPGVVPELLSIGQEVILPPPATAVFQANQATAIPPQIRVESAVLSETPVGGLWVLGEVQNIGERSALNVRLEIELLDASGGSLGSVSAWVIPDLIRPQQKAPFGVLLSEPPQGVAQTRVAVVGGETSAADERILAVQNHTLEFEGNVAKIAGEVANEGEAAVTRTLLVATLYNAQGAVTGFAQHELNAAIHPGETLPFELEVAPPGGRSTAVGFALRVITAEN